MVEPERLNLEALDVRALAEEYGLDPVGMEQHLKRLSVPLFPVDGRPKVLQETWRALVRQLLTGEADMVSSEQANPGEPKWLQSYANLAPLYDGLTRRITEHDPGALIRPQATTTTIILSDGRKAGIVAAGGGTRLQLYCNRNNKTLLHPLRTEADIDPSVTWVLSLPGYGKNG